MGPGLVEVIQTVMTDTIEDVPIVLHTTGISGTVVEDERPRFRFTATSQGTSLA